MAQALIEQWRLAVLLVRLDLTERTPAVVTELLGYPGGTPHTYWRLQLPLEAFGLARTAAPPRRLTVPDELSDRITRSLLDDLPDQTALWLRMVPPYGYLGAVPWEEAIVRSDLPLLRVPDRLPAAADPGQAWSIAIAINAPEGTWVAPYVENFVTALRTVVESDVDVHVFADAASHWALRADLDALPGGAVHLHEPSDARRVHDERSTRDIGQFRTTGRESAVPPSEMRGLLWADWIATGLAGRAVRALHVVADGMFDADRPLFAVSPDPNHPTGRADCAFVSGDGVRTLADTIGAAAVSFGSPPDNPWDVATRMMADEVGLSRPGPTLYSSLRRDPDGEALARTYAFVANEPGRDLFPRHRSLFAYLQPERVQAMMTEPWRRAAGANTSLTLPVPLPDPAPSHEVSAHYATAHAVPVWVAASERYIDAKVGDIVHTAVSEDEGSAAKRAYNSGTVEALSELRGLVARHVRGS